MTIMTTDQGVRLMKMLTVKTERTENLQVNQLGQNIYPVFESFFVHTPLMINIDDRSLWTYMSLYVYTADQLSE